MIINDPMIQNWLVNLQNIDIHHLHNTLAFKFVTQMMFTIKKNIWEEKTKKTKKSKEKVNESKSKMVKTINDYFSHNRY